MQIVIASENAAGKIGKFTCQVENLVWSLPWEVL
jgi:hypothetical protein